MIKMDDCWKDFLLNQFHDVLPGSCIEAVAKDAWKIYEDLFEKLMEIRTRYNGAILGNGANKAVFNCLPWETKTVIFMKPDAGNPPEGDNVQAVTLSSDEFENQGQGMFRVPNTFSAALVTLNPSGYTLLTPEAPAVPVSFSSKIKIQYFFSFLANFKIFYCLRRWRWNSWNLHEWSTNIAGRYCGWNPS
jgi:hypothetical protein